MKNLTAKLGLTLGGILLLAVPLCSAAVGDFTVYPTYMHGDNKNWILQKVNAGDTITDFITLENTRDTAETLQLIFREAETKGKTFITKEDQAFTDLGTWIKLPQTEYTLNPHEKIKVPFEISVPGETDPRQYIGTILATKSEKTPQDLNIVTRIGVRIYLDVVPAGALNVNIFSATGSPNPYFFIFSLLLLGTAVTYNVIHYLGNKNYENQKA